MAHHANALKHHELAGHALAKKDYKQAAHHFGHAMNALKSKPAAPPMIEGGEPDVDDVPMRQPSKLRGMLKGFGGMK